MKSYLFWNEIHTVVFAVIKKLWAIILMTPHHLLEASDTPAITSSKESGLLNTRGGSLSKSGYKCGLHNSGKTLPVFTGIGLEFVLRHPGGVDLSYAVTERFFFREICAEKPSIIRCKPAISGFCLSYDEKRSVFEFLS